MEFVILGCALLTYLMAGFAIVLAAWACLVMRIVRLIEFLIVFLVALSLAMVGSDKALEQLQGLGP